MRQSSVDTPKTLPKTPPMDHSLDAAPYLFRASYKEFADKCFGDLEAYYALLP